LGARQLACNSDQRYGKPPDRVNVTVRGQVQPMAEMFGGLRLGSDGGFVILLLLTANFNRSGFRWRWG